MSENPSEQPPDSAYPPPVNPYASQGLTGVPPPSTDRLYAYPPPPPPGGAYPPTVGQPVNATSILVLGILGLTVCLICAPIAWVMGNQAVTTLNGYGDPLNQRGTVNAGRICGIIGTALMGLVLLFYIVMFLIGLVGSVTHPSS